MFTYKCCYNIIKDNSMVVKAKGQSEAAVAT